MSYYGDSIDIAPIRRGNPFTEERWEARGEKSMTVRRVVLEHTGRWFIADPRMYEKDEEHWYCVHRGTVSAKNREDSLRYQMRSVTRGHLPIYVFEARNATQAHQWLREHGYITQYNSVKKGHSNMNAIDRRKRQAELAIERAQAELDRLYRLPDEPVVEDDAPNVIFFQKKFSPSGRLYDYSAIKASDGLWYTTGPRSPHGYPWDRLVEWMFDGHEDLTIYVAKKFKPLS